MDGEYKNKMVWMRGKSEKHKCLVYKVFQSLRSFREDIKGIHF
jgi:hypothetical protein